MYYINAFISLYVHDARHLSVGSGQVSEARLGALHFIQLVELLIPEWSGRCHKWLVGEDNNVGVAFRKERVAGWTQGTSSSIFSLQSGVPIKNLHTEMERWSFMHRNGYKR